MRFLTTEVELARPVHAISLAADEGGVAVLVRWRGRPVAFVLRELPPSTVLAPEQVSALIAELGGLDVLEEALRGELLAGESDPPHAAPDVTVAVCTRARTADLRACVRSILATGATGGSFELLVVDNDPPDDSTRQLVRSLPEVRYACEPRPGLDFARNRALREARGEFVAFVDDDVVVDVGWLDGIAEALAEHPDAAVVTGLVLPYELESEAQVLFERRGGFRRGFRKLRFQGERLPRNPLYPAGAGIFGAGCNMLVRKDAVLRLGGFDEALDTGPPLPGGGDLDVFYRVLRAGHPLVYEPRMLVFHKHRRERGALRRQYWTWGTGFMAFVSKAYRHEPDERLKLRRLVRWWCGDQAAELWRSTRGRSVLTPDLVAAELAGGLVGLTGKYARSARRSELIRRRAR